MPKVFNSKVVLCVQAYPSAIITYVWTWFFKIRLGPHAIILWTIVPFACFCLVNWFDQNRGGDERIQRNDRNKGDERSRGRRTAASPASSHPRRKFHRCCLAVPLTCWPFHHRRLVQFFSCPGAPLVPSPPPHLIVTLSNMNFFR